jgi:hypothetical protein
MSPSNHILSAPKMKYPKLAFLIASLAVTSSVEASVTMVWSSQLELPAYASDGTSAFTSNFMVELGIFKSPFSPNASNLASWETEWVPFGTTAYNPVDNYYSGITSLQNNTNAPAGSQVYVWIKGPTNPNGSMEWFIVTDDSSDSNPTDDWLVPDTTGSDQTTRPVYYDLLASAPPSTILFGAKSDGVGSGTGSAPPAGFAVQTYATAPIPEPSSSLAAAALLGIFGARRRRRA